MKPNSLLKFCFFFLALIFCLLGQMNAYGGDNGKPPPTTPPPPTPPEDQTDPPKKDDTNGKQNSNAATLFSEEATYENFEEQESSDIFDKERLGS